MSYDSLFLSRACHGDLSVFGQIVYRCRMTPGQLADYCMVSPETVRRWIRTKKPNPTALKLLAIKAGYLPWESCKDREMQRLPVPASPDHACGIRLSAQSRAETPEPCAAAGIGEIQVTSVGKTVSDQTWLTGLVFVQVYRHSARRRQPMSLPHD
jgi:hypothetical protein